MIKTTTWMTSAGNAEKKACEINRKVEDVFKELSDTLVAYGLLPDEYFYLDEEFEKYKDFPILHDMYCYARWGSSEGIYLDVIAVVFNNQELEYELKRFAVGKTLSEDRDSYDRMQYIAGYIYKLFMGDHQIPMRYLKMDQEKICNRAALMKKLEQEYREMAMRVLFSQDEMNTKMLSELSLKGKILSVLPDCLIPDEKIHELMKQENALDTLYQLCQSISECDAFEINDIISSCRSFIG